MITTQEAIKQLREAAGAVVRLDWSSNRYEHIQVIDALLGALAATAPEKSVNNFCPDCGKRSGPVGHIHTCSPPEKVEPVAERDPTVEQLQEMACELQVVPRGDVVDIHWLQTLKRQYLAAMKAASIQNPIHQSIQQSRVEANERASSSKILPAPRMSDDALDEIIYKFHDGKMVEPVADGRPPIAMMNAGAYMSNCMFNFAQYEGRVLSKEDCANFDRLRKEWDAARSILAQPTIQQSAVADGWISVDERLPDVGVGVLVYTPPQEGDWPDSVRIDFDCIDPDADDPTFWLEHGNHYEHFCCVAKPEGTTGPSEKAPYTHWRPLPAPPAQQEDA